MLKRSKYSSDDEITHSSLDGDLPEGQILALHRSTGILALLSCDQGQPILQKAEHFTPDGIAMLRQMIETYPYCCPYEVLLTCYLCGVVTEKHLKRIQKRLTEATEEGLREAELNSLRVELTQIRHKMRKFGLDLITVQGFGCGLTLTSSNEDRKVPD